MNCVEFVIILLPVPKVKKLSVQSRKRVEDAKGEHLHHLPPNDDIKFF
jgi:hypothetical protein